MTPQRVAVKIFEEAGRAEALDLEPFTPLFHQFIQEASVPGLLIDVADYAHVPNGPGIVLIGHEVDYAVDSVGGRTGLLVIGKRCGDAPVAESLRDTLHKAVRCAQAIEQDGRTGLTFNTGEIEFQLFDRLAAPNDQETCEALQTALQATFSFLGEGASFERTSGDDARKPASVLARSAEEHDLAGVLGAIGG